MSKENPWPHQHLAIAKVVDGFSSHNRGQLIMACGTGKTAVSNWVAEKIACRRVAYFVPNLSLASQVIRDWGRWIENPPEILAVCSDKKVFGEDEIRVRTKDLGVPVSTDPETIRKFLVGQNKRMRLVIATYQSSGKLEDAFGIGAPAFDLLIADEAHRCAGTDTDKMFTTVLNGNRILAAKRLFMTATPRIYSARIKARGSEDSYEVASMDDPAKFGPVFHNLTFGEAIQNGLLAKYKIVINFVSKREVLRAVENDKSPAKLREYAKLVGMIKAMKEHDVRRCIAFLSSVKRVEQFAATDISAMARSIGVDLGEVKVLHVTGEMDAGRRDDALREFANCQERVILANCKCLQEGVDVKSTDAVAFIDPRSSKLDVAQAVGRAIRKDGDKIGKIIVSAFTDDPNADDYAIEKSPYRAIAHVSRAMQEIDGSLALQVNRLPTCDVNDRKITTENIDITLPDDVGGDATLPGPTAQFPVSLSGSRIDFSDIVSHIHAAAIWPFAKPLSIQEVRQWVVDWHRTIGKYPSSGGGDRVSQSGLKWNTIDHHLRSGGRGLPGGSSLAEEVRKLDDGHTAVARISIDDAKRWISAFHDRTGKWPGYATTGRIPECPSHTWQSLGQYLLSGSPRTSLGDLVVGMGGTAIRHSIDYDEIDRMIALHVSRHVELPSTGTSNFWRNTDSKLRRRGSSLAAYLVAPYANRRAESRFGRRRRTAVSAAR